MSAQTPLPTRPERHGRARLAISAIFAIQGIGSASWFVRIPAVQQELQLSAGTLGFALLGVALGSLVALPTTGWLVTRFGSRPVTTVATPLFCATIPLPALAQGPVSLFVSLIGLGAGIAVMDVAMNVQGVAVERRISRPILSSLHGMYSVGGLAGAAAGGVVAALGVAPLAHLSGVALALGAVGLLAPRWLLGGGIDVRPQGPAFARPTRALAGLGMISFCGLLSEGAMADWTALYLRQSLETGPGLAAAGYGVFSVTMALGRLLGDQVVARFGPARSVRASGLIASLGLGASLLIPHPLAALVGFGCVGSGLSIVFPTALSAAGRIPGVQPGPAIAAVSTTGYFGFLAGPPAIGLLAEAWSLRGGLGIVVLLSAAVALLAGTVARPGAED